MFRYQGLFKGYRRWFRFKKCVNTPFLTARLRVVRFVAFDRAAPALVAPAPVRAAPAPDRGLKDFAWVPTPSSRRNARFAELPQPPARLRPPDVPRDFCMQHARWQPLRGFN